MPRVVVDKFNFAAGQIDEAARTDSAKTIYDGGVAAALNYRVLNGRGAKRRPGSWWRATIFTGKAVGAEYITEAGDVFKLVFSHEQLTVYDSDNAVAATLVDQAWGSAIVDELYFEVSEKQFIVCHHDIWPQVVTVDTDGNWSVGDFVFADAPGGGTAQPYYNYQAKGVTLAPDALTGGVGLTTSDDFFDTDHEDTIIRYLGREIMIDTVNSATDADGTVIQTLPGTYTIVVADGTGFEIDESVQGLDSGAKGIITAASGTTLTVVLEEGLTGFTTGEVLVGDGNSQSAIASTTPTTPAAVLDWDEQAFSAVRGYPGGACHHRGRLYFFDFRDLPRAVTASAAGFTDDFEVGANDGDAFFELVPEYKGQRVRHVVSADQGIILTDRMAYYLPEYGTQVVTPSTVAFKEISPIGAAKPKPAKTERGAMYLEEGTNRIIGLIPSGNVQSPWDAEDISIFWSELMTGPRSLAADVANTGWPERYGFVVNDDGTAAVLRYDAPGSDVPVGWVPWESQGAIRSIFSAGGSLFAICQYLIADAETWILAEFDDDIYLDAALAYAGAADMLTEFENTTVNVMLDYQSIDAFAVDGTGLLTGFDLDDDDYVAGLDICTHLELLPPKIAHPAFVQGKRYAIPKMQLHVKDSSVYSLNGVLNPAYRAGENLDNPPKLRTEARQFGIAGRAPGLVPEVTQTVPSPITVLGATMEAAF